MQWSHQWCQYACISAYRNHYNLNVLPSGVDMRACKRIKCNVVPSGVNVRVWGCNHCRVLMGDVVLGEECSVLQAANSKG